PLYFREGTIVPMLSGVPHDNRSDLSRIELHIFLSRRSTGRPEDPARAEVRYDDGHSFDYRRPEGRSLLHVAAWVERDTICLDLSGAELGYGDFTVQPVVYDNFRSLVVITEEGRREVALTSHNWSCCNRRLDCLKGPWIRVAHRGR
ncbi:hypothetical protein, partial [Salinispira pacifica]